MQSNGTVKEVFHEIHAIFSIWDASVRIFCRRQTTTTEQRRRELLEVMVSNTAWKSGYSSANDYKEATHRIRCHRRLLIGGKCLPGYDYRTIGSASKLHHCHAHHRDSNKRPRPQYHVTKTE